MTKQSTGLGITLLKEPPLASTFDKAAIQNIRTSSVALWSALQKASAGLRDKPGGKLSVAFSSPHPVNSATMKLYAERAHIPMTIRPHDDTRPLF